MIKVSEELVDCLIDFFNTRIKFLEDETDKPNFEKDHETAIEKLYKKIDEEFPDA